METGDLIRALSADAAGPRFSLGTIVAACGLAGDHGRAAIFFAFIGPRPDVAAAAGTVRFLFKFVVAGLLAATALAALVTLSRPERAAAAGSPRSPPRRWLCWLPSRSN